MILRLGERAKVAALLRTTLTAQTHTLGTDHEHTPSTERLLASALNIMGKCAEAESLSRKLLEK